MKQETQTTLKTRNGVAIYIVRYESQERDAAAVAQDILLLHGWPNSGQIRGFVHATT